MATWVVVISLVLLVALCAYWEWRYRTFGWGRGLMRNSADRVSHHGYTSEVDPEEVWGPSEVHDHVHVDEQGNVHVSVKRGVYDWESRGDFEE